MDFSCPSRRYNIVSESYVKNSSSGMRPINNADDIRTEGDTAYMRIFILGLKEGNPY